MLLGLTFFALRTDAQGNLNWPAIVGLAAVMVVFYLSRRGGGNRK